MAKSDVEAREIDTPLVGVGHMLWRSRPKYSEHTYQTLKLVERCC